MRGWLGFVFLIVGCTLTPTMPDGAEPLDPAPAIYRQWWRDVEECSGRRGDFNTVAWMIYRDRDVIALNNRTTASVWDQQRIYVTRKSVNDSTDVRYAILRYLLPGANDEPAVYMAMCAEVVG